jgi:3-deoxy-manno-octulosonate cytidylyltransferase (CMP-KDO synthetase)
MYKCRLWGISTVTNTSIVAIIPAHMASVRFPGKILHPFFGVPMVEHVRRRALISKKIDDVFIATGDQEISDVISGYGGNIIKTNSAHFNGTSRIAEAAKKINATHFMLLQGDEPLLLPSFVDTIAEAIISAPKGDAWNGVGPIQQSEELDRHSFVKCAMNSRNKIMYCFRRSPSFASFETQKKFMRKILGIMAFKKTFLEKLVLLPAAQTELAESIEQMRIIENGYEIEGVDLGRSLPSVNEPHEADIVEEYIHKNKEQRALLMRTLGVQIR